MKHKANNINRAMMFGVMAMAVVVLLVMMLFLGWMGESKNKETDQNDSTTVDKENTEVLNIEING